MSEKKYCGGCARFRANTRYGERYNCTYRGDEDVYAESEACKLYWDEAERREEFCDWVTSEVLPAIRKHGACQRRRTWNEVEK